MQEMVSNNVGKHVGNCIQILETVSVKYCKTKVYLAVAEGQNEVLDNNSI